MKIKLLLSVALFTLSATLAVHAQSDLYPKEGDRSVNIRINPLFSYMGNFFSQAGNNSLNLTGADLLYRRFLTDNKVKRIRGEVAFRSSANQTQGFFAPINDILFLGTQQDHSYFANLGIGKEYRHSVNRFSVYSGWEFLSSISFNRIDYRYTFNDGDILPEPIFRTGTLRPLNIQRGFGIDVGFAGVFGGEYFLTKHISVGAELLLPATIGYRFQATSKFEIVDTSQNPIVLRTTQTYTETIPASIVGSAFTNSTILFRAGFIF